VLEEKIRTDLNDAMKNRDSEKVGTLRFLLAAIKNVTIEKRQPLSDDEVISVIQKQIKSRNDSIELYRTGGREGLAEKEQREIAIIQAYLPVQLSDDELENLIKNAIRETGAVSRKDMGKVMSHLSSEIAGKADKGKVAQIAGKLLDNGQ